jgi:hypothetical protein
MAPVTVGGRIFGVFTALTGVIVLAMPTTVIGTNFSDIYESYYARKREEVVHSCVNNIALTIIDPQEGYECHPIGVCLDRKGLCNLTNEAPAF